jgi:hypothetical protein
MADSGHVVLAEPTGEPLVHDVREQEPIAQNVLTVGQRRTDYFLDELSPARHEEQHLSAIGKVLGRAILKQCSKAIAQRRTSRIATRDDAPSRLAKPLRQPRNLGRLAAAIRPVKHEEQSPREAAGRRFALIRLHVEVASCVAVSAGQFVRASISGA